jgi:predicted MFS family arabinose efflux permease
MIKNIPVITASAYLSMLFLGVASSLVGAAARNIGLTPFQIGLMIAFQNLGFMLSVLISGALADTHEKPRLLLIGSLILSPAFLFFYLSPVFVVNLIIMFLIGTGIGTYEGVTDALLLDIHPQKAGLHINLNHFFVTFGSILITSYLLFLQMDWRRAVTQSGILVIILALIFAFMKLGRRETESVSYRERLGWLSKEKVVTAFFIATIVVVGVEAGTIGILTTFLMELRGFTQITSKVGLILFLGGIAVGRVLLGALTRKENISRTILYLFGASTVVFGILYLVDLGILTYLAIFLAGLSTSALLPLMLTQAGILYKDVAGMVLGSIKVAIPLGGILIPFLMSSIVRFSSFQSSLWIFPLAFLVTLVLLYVTFGQMSKVSAISTG